jgi:hypothetical protein
VSTRDLGLVSFRLWLQLIAPDMAKDMSTPAHIVGWRLGASSLASGLTGFVLGFTPLGVWGGVLSVPLWLRVFRPLRREKSGEGG